MVHAFFGLLNYEEKDGRFSFLHKEGSEHFLLPFGGEQDLAKMPRIFALKPRKKTVQNHLEETQASFEEELPEGNLFHLVLPKEMEKRRKKKVVRTPFGEFTIRELFFPLPSMERASV